MTSSTFEDSSAISSASNLPIFLPQQVCLWHDPPKADPLWRKIVDLQFAIAGRNGKKINESAVVLFCAQHMALFVDR